MIEFKNILVPVDFSDNSVQALDFGQYLAKQNKALLHVLHIIEPVYFPHESYKSDNDVYLHETRIRDAKRELSKFIVKNSKTGIDFTEVLNVGKPFEEILTYSQSKKIDVIVMASHGWTSLSHLTTGSVTNKVMRLSEIPVICVKVNNANLPKGTAASKYTLAENWMG